MTDTFFLHPQRQLLNNEDHVRTPVSVPSPAQVTSLAFFFDDDGSRQRQALSRLAAQLGLPLPAADAVQYQAELPGLRLNWGLHTEFARYTLLRRGRTGEPFADSAFEGLPLDWLSNQADPLLVAIHAVILPQEDAGAADTETLAQQWFAGNDLVGASIGDGNAMALTDLRLHPDRNLGAGVTRLLVLDYGMSASQRGRMLQRLFELETYRMLALLALPVAKAQVRVMDDLGRRMRALTGQMSGKSGARSSDDALLDQLTELAADLEDAISSTQYRFSAGQAYYRQVERRIEELREARLGGVQPFREFTIRRLAPAMATCETIGNRQTQLAARIQRATALLRTRVEVSLQGQNQALLASMDRRAELQLRLQETVEGLSVGVLTYYAVGLIGYLAKALKVAGAPVNPELVTGLAIPLVAAGVWWGTQKMKKSLGH